eukprot:12916413-Prorocentrum_lima.AAC.1
MLGAGSTYEDPVQGRNRTRDYVLCDDWLWRFALAGQTDMAAHSVFLQDGNLFHGAAHVRFAGTPPAPTRAR